MYDKELALDSLSNIENALNTILERAAVANTADDFLMSPDGMMRLDADIPPMLSVIHRMIDDINKNGNNSSFYY